MASRHARIAGQGYPFLVATVDGEVGGYAYANAYHARPAFRLTVETSIYLGAHHRRQGIGTLLLRELIDLCEARGFRQMIAVVGDSRNAGSISLHSRAGFANVGTLRSTGWKFGRWLDIVVMQRALGAGDATPAE